MNDELMGTENGGLSAIVPEVWSRKYYDVLLASLPFNALMNNEYTGDIKELGDTVKISSFPEFEDADILPEDQAANADKITVAQQSLIINKRIVKDFIVTSKALIQSLPAMDKLKELASYAINKKIQKEIIALTVPVAGNQVSYDSGTTLGLADLLEMKEKLDEANVPLSGRHMVVGSEQLNDIFNITGFTSSDFIVNGSPLQTGEIPSMLVGFLPHFTTEVGDTAYLFHESYMALAPQKGLGVVEYDLGVNGVRATRVNLDTLVGIKQLADDRVGTLG